MKLQVAIDRVSLDRAEEMIEKLNGHADIIEVGTSLVKEFGISQLNNLVKASSSSEILADMKVSDEGAYEAELACSTGFAYFTAMASASHSTLEACYDVARKHSATLMLDLLECDDERIAQMSDFENAVYCLHTSVDSGDTTNPAQQVRAFKARFPQIQHIAIAGGIKPEHVADLSAEGVEIVVMGSAITKADDIAQACADCKQLMH
ncbi:orotidine 5'-phosphate decarboxylase / HUMPS family protein [Alloscardovia criceti]|uniref:orotidine 5'-phosphate decarboxylase / HUMPS family protein n=1 Tax=Alloscardovia criceti TaxID=356828 RepID=UPI000362C4A1|nr:orotidine 5'-phosphate decarboxylase / HUMPS family protein [Alloscardovia criceti]